MSKALNCDPGILLANPWNTNIMTPDGEAKLDNSLRRFGCYKPIVVREIDVDGETRFEIIGGEHRAQSALRIGLAKVPIMNLGPIGDKEAKEISLADNARYGADDTLALAQLLNELGDAKDIQQFLPFTNEDLSSIFNAEAIDLDELEIEEKFDTDEKPAEPEPPALKVPKTHTIMRYKVSLGDAERIAELIARTKTAYGYTAGDDLTNAGDALVHLLLKVEE